MTERRDGTSLIRLGLTESWAETSLSESFPSFWIYFQGALFILVVAFLPNGLATVGRLFRRRKKEPDPVPVPEPAALEPTGTPS